MAGVEDVEAILALLTSRTTVMDNWWSFQTLWPSRTFLPSDIVRNLHALESWKSNE